jgi:TRAP-type C4-dicarboxylate transport system permease small subunit
MAQPRKILRFVALVLLCIAGFVLGYGGVRYYKKTHPDEIQRQPAPELPVQ